MAAAGLVEDQIALRIGDDKNSLRRKYIDAVKAGRAKNREVRARAEKLTRQQLAVREALTRSFDTGWFSPEIGHLICRDCWTPEEAIEWFENPGTAAPDLLED
jgi:hypothetical protein